MLISTHNKTNVFKVYSFFRTKWLIMVYINHIYANVEAIDDSGANVYAVVIEKPDQGSSTDWILTDQSLRENVKNFILANKHADYVYRLTQDGTDGGDAIPGDLSRSTFVFRNMTRYISNTDSNHIVDNLDVSRYYGVYMVAEDSYNHSTELTGGNVDTINKRPPPIIQDYSASINDNLEIELYANISSDVYFEYSFAVFNTLLLDDQKSSLISFFNQNAYVHSSNVTTGFDEFGTLVKSQIQNTVFPFAYANIEDPNDYDAISKTTKYYIYYHLKNTDDKHDRDIMGNVETNVISSSVLTLSSLIVETYDNAANISFHVNQTSNIQFYVDVFSRQYTDYQTNGPLKSRLLYSSTVTKGNVDDYVNGNVDVYINRFYSNIESDIPKYMTDNQQYYAYVRVRDIYTGEMSTLSELILSTGKAPITDIRIDARNIDSVSALNTTIFEQSNTDIYMSIILYDGIITNDEIISFMLGNSDIHAYGLSDPINSLTVNKLSAQVPVNGVIDIVHSATFYKVHTNIQDPNAYQTISADGTNQNLYVYAIDELGYANLNYIPIGNKEGVNLSRVINPNILSVSNLDTSFVVSCENADDDAIHYIMAFENDIIHTDILNNGLLMTNMKSYGTRANTSNDITISNYFDIDGNNGTSIVSGNVYNVYTIAVDPTTNKMFVDESNSVLRNLRAQYIPEIHSIIINFNTGKTVVNDI